MRFELKGLIQTDLVAVTAIGIVGWELSVFLMMASATDPRMDGGRRL